MKALILQVPHCNSLLISTPDGIKTVILSGVQSPQTDENLQFSAKEFLRSKLIDKSCTVTKFKDTARENQFIGKATLCEKSVAVNLAKNGYCEPFGKGDEFDACTAAWANHKQPKIYQIKDLTKKSSELSQFATSKQTFPGYIDFVRDSATFLMYLFTGETEATKIVGTLHGIYDESETLKNDLQKLVQHDLIVKLVQNTSSNIVDCDITVKETGQNLNKKYASLAKKQAKQENVSRIEAVNSGDSFTIINKDGEEQRLFLSSIQCPKFQTFGQNAVCEAGGYEARNYLRNLIYGKEMKIIVDYQRELGSNNAPEGENVEAKAQKAVNRVYCSVYDQQSGENIAFQLIKSGLFKCVHHSLKDMNRSPDYDQLVELQAEAEKNKVGLFSNTQYVQFKIADFGSLKPEELKTRASRFATQKDIIKCTIEQVIQSSKFKVLIKIDAQTLAFAIVQMAGVGSIRDAGQQQAIQFSRSHYLYKELTIKFIGDLEKHTNAFFVLLYDNMKLINYEIVCNGFGYCQLFKNSIKELDCLKKGEFEAKQAKRGVYASAIEQCELQKEEMVSIKSVDQYCNIVVRPCRFARAMIKTSQQLQKGDILRNMYCVYKDNQGACYRARILENDPEIRIFLIDEGTEEVVSQNQLFVLDEQYLSLQQQTAVIRNACIDLVMIKDCKDEIERLIGQNLLIQEVPQYPGDYLIMAGGVKEISAENSFSLYLVENGLARVKEEYRGDWSDALLSAEQNAIQGNIGYWNQNQ